MRADYLTQAEYQHIRRLKAHTVEDEVIFNEPEPALKRPTSIFSRSFYDPEKVHNLIRLKPDRTQKIGLALIFLSPIGFYLTIQAIFSQTL